MKTWRIDAQDQTLVLASDGGVPYTVYWGAPLPQDEDLAHLAANAALDITGGMLDGNPPLSLSPEASQTFQGQTGLIAYRDGVAVAPKLKLTSVDGTTFTTHGDGLTLTFDFGVTGGMITAQTRLTSETDVTLHHLAAPVLPAPQHADEIIDFSGRWIGEFQMERSPWHAGIHMRESRTGRSGHEHPPFAIFPETGCTNTQGAAFGMHYGWSGGHVMKAEELPCGRRQIQWGHATGTQGTGTSFETAILYLTRSGCGLNGLATTFQRYLRDDHVVWPKPDTPRPVHYNCWEAVYFDHKIPELQAIATRAAELGAERFVLDDGWFGKRDDDTASLGDWDIDPRKYPDGLAPLIDHIHGLGMRFGIWFEPEMVNPESDLYRSHPEWALGDGDQLPGRQQFVLNMALPEVREYVYTKIAAVLSAYDVDYIKWDHNRLLPTLSADQTNGTYALLDRLRTDFPLVEIESCASGGGSIDFGILERTSRVWLSDSNDAQERLRIQHDAALFLPWQVTGSHVGPRTCHTSGRTHDMHFRAWVAAQRHMGFEMDPRELTEHEAKVLSDVTTWWKANREWRARADILRLDSADPAIIAEQQLAQDGARFVVFAGRAATSRQIAPRPLRLTGLTPDATYRIALANKNEAHHLSRGDQTIKTDAISLSGRALMEQGVSLPWSFPDTMWVLEGERL